MWLNVFYYLQGIPHTGPYVRTIFEVLADMAAFMVLYLVIVTGFSHAFFMAFPVVAGSDSGTAGEAIWYMWQMTYRMGTLGDFDPDEFEGKLHLYVLFFGSTFVITIMFLNVRRMHLISFPMIAITPDPEFRLQCTCSDSFLVVVESFA